MYPRSRPLAYARMSRSPLLSAFEASERQQRQQQQTEALQACYGEAVRGKDALGPCGFGKLVGIRAPIGEGDLELAEAVFPSVKFASGEGKSRG
jgi:hypothetical protein